MPSSSRFAPALALAAAAVIAGCALPQAEPPAVPPPVSAAPLPAAPAGAWAWTPELESAGTRLRAALSGSGAEVSQTPDQRLWISLPTAFPAGRAAVSPAATPWLDRVAASLRSLPRAQVQIVGPADARGGAALAVDRAASARDWMVMRGVPAHRMVVTGQDPRGRPPAGEARLHIFVGERSTR